MAETIGYDRRIGRRPGKKLLEKLSLAFTQFTRGQEYRQQRREGTWAESAAQYDGSVAWRGNPDDKSADLVNVNLSFSTLNTLLPFVADEDPTFIVEPYSGEANAEHATLLQSFLNRYWRSNEVQGTRHLRDATFDYLLYGDGYAKVGYEIHEKPVFTEDGNEVPNQVEIADFFVERLNPWDVWIDPFSDGIFNARWVCQRLTLPRKEVEESDQYNFGPKDDNAGIDRDNMSAEDQSRLDRTAIDEFITL